MRTDRIWGGLSAGLIAVAMLSVNAAQAAPRNGGSATCGEYKYHDGGKCVDARQKGGKSWPEEIMSKKWAG